MRGKVVFRLKIRAVKSNFSDLRGGGYCPLPLRVASDSNHFFVRNISKVRVFVQSRFMHDRFYCSDFRNAGKRSFTKFLQQVISMRRNYFAVHSDASCWWFWLGRFTGLRLECDLLVRFGLVVARLNRIHSFWKKVWQKLIFRWEEGNNACLRKINVATKNTRNNKKIQKKTKFFGQTFWK